MEVTEKVVVLTQEKAMLTKKAIENIETQMEVFCTYAAVKSKKHLEDIPELMVYAATIVKGARDYMVATTGRHMTTILDRRRCVMCNMELWNN